MENLRHNQDAEPADSLEDAPPILDLLERTIALVDERMAAHEKRPKTRAEQDAGPEVPAVKRRGSRNSFLSRIYTRRSEW